MNPFSSADPVTDPNMFVGRATEQQEFLEEWRSTLFIGEHGIGKTSLLLSLQREIESGAVVRVSVCPIWVDLESPIFQHPDEVLRFIGNRISDFVEEKYHHTSSRETAHEKNDGVSLVLKLLEDLEARQIICRFLLLVDNLHAFGAETGLRNSLFQRFRVVIDHSPPHNNVTLAGAATNAFLDMEPPHISSLRSRLRPVFLSALSEDECKDLVSRATEHRSVSEIDEQTHSFVYQKTGGHPYLVQNLMQRALLNLDYQPSLRESLEEVARRMVTDSSGIFEKWTRAVSVGELVYLVGLALKIRLDSWRTTGASIERLSSTGVVRAVIKDGQEYPVASCDLFLDWLRANTRRLFKLSPHSISLVNDVVSVIALLQNTVRKAVDRRDLSKESELQGIVAAVLAAHELSFVREQPRFKYEGKTFIPDFVLEPLGIVIEVKLVRDTRPLDKVVGEILRVREAYAHKFDHVVFLIYDLTGRIDEKRLFKDKQSPKITYVVIQHSTE